MVVYFCMVGIRLSLLGSHLTRRRAAIVISITIVVTEMSCSITKKVHVVEQHHELY